MKNVFSIAAGIALILVSLVASVVCLVAIFDPVGTQAADDNDPFGTPPSRAVSASALCISVAVGAAGLYLMLKPSRSHHDASIT